MSASSIAAGPVGRGSVGEVHPTLDLKYAPCLFFSGRPEVAFKHACFISYCRPQHELLSPGR
jgi:hypothetical protein